jgi:hypothetical protein
VLEHLRRRACNQSDDAAKNAKRLKDFQGYCDKFIEALRNWKKMVGKDVDGYRKKRRESYDRAFKSYYKGAGVNSTTANNVVVSRDLEDDFCASICNEEKRLIFFGKGAT